MDSAMDTATVTGTLSGVILSKLTVKGHFGSLQTVTNRYFSDFGIDFGIIAWIVPCTYPCSHPTRPKNLSVAAIIG